MVDKVVIPAYEQVPLRPDISQGDLPYVRPPMGLQESGYGEGDQNQFYSERQAYIWANAVPEKTHAGYTAALDALEASIEATNRKLAERELADTSAKVALDERAFQLQLAAIQDTSEAALAMGTAAVNNTQALIDTSREEPKKAASAATVQLLNPAMDETLKQGFAFRDHQKGTVAARLQNRKIIDFSMSNWVADAGALLTVPARITFAQTKFPESYYNRMLEWKNLTTAEQAQQWDALESQLWDASGNNAIVYSSLITPFLDEHDEAWAFIDTGLDAVALVGTLMSVYRLGGAAFRLAKLTRLRNAAMEVGNTLVAGEDTARSIARGDPASVLEAHPIRVPDEAAAVPGVQPGLEVPTTSHIVRDLVDNGVIPETATDVPVENLAPLNDSERAAAIDRAKNQIGESGNILRVDEHEAGFDIIISEPGIEHVPVRDAARELAAVEEELSIARGSLRNLLKHSEVGETTGEIAALNNQIDTLKARKSILRKGIKDAKVLEGSGFKISAIKLPGGPPTERRIPFKWTVDDAGLITFEEGQIPLPAHLLASQEMRADRVMAGITGEGTFISLQQRRLFSTIVKRVREIEKTLKSGPIRRLTGRSEKQRVGAVLLKGDQEQRVYSDVELAIGIETPEMGLVKLNEKEIAAYRDMRKVFDDLWRMLNKTQRDDLQFAGFSSILVNHTSRDGTIRRIAQFVKARHEDIVHTLPRIGTNDITHAIDARTGTVVDLGTVARLDEDLRAGRKGFVELQKDFINGDGSRYRHVLVDVDKVGDLKRARNVYDLPSQVLDFRRGYVPKIVADRVGFVVETFGDIVRNGIRTRGSASFRGFMTRAEADIWKQRQIARGGTGTSEYRIHDLNDVTFRNNNPEANDYVSQQLFLGAFGGDRTDGVFKVGLEGYEAGRMSAFEAVRRYADYIGRHAPMHSFKQAMIKRFMNSIKADDGTRLLETKWDWTSKLTMPRSDPRYRSAKAIQEWMKAVFALPVTEERWYQKIGMTLGYAMDRVVWNVAEGEKRFGSGFTSWVQNKLVTSPWSRNPVQQTKALTFDLVLGMFNPMQYVVQSAGMAVPLSMHPIEGVAVMPKFLALRTLWKMRNADDVATVASMMGLNGDHFAHMWAGYRRSGFIDSILENADFGHYVTSAHGYYSPGFMQGLKERGRIFYNMGELNSRTFAWTMAYERMMKANRWSRTRALTSEQVLEINKEALRLNMNMTQANKARWQNGEAGLMTQFMQVTGRFYENMFAGFFNVNKGGKWTRQEAFTAFATSTFMFGAANWSADELWSGFETWLVDPQGPFALDPKKDAATIAAARGGFLELMAFETLGWTPDISDRISLGSGSNMVYENIVAPIADYLIEGDASVLASALIGASSVVGTRFHKSAAHLWEIFRSDVLTGKMDTNTVVSAAADIAKLTSTGSNALKARMWNQLNEIINDKTGQPFGMAHPSENPGLIYLQAVGLSPLDIEKYYIIDRKSKAYAEQVKEISNTLATAYRELLTSGDVVDPLERERLQRTLSLMMSDLEPAERHQVMKNMEKLWKEDDKIGNLKQKLFEQLMNATETEDASKPAADAQILQGME